MKKLSILLIILFLHACQSAPPITTTPKTNNFISTPTKQSEDAEQTEWQYYVNGTTGSDLNLGTQDNPWRTIQHAADNIVPGDTVNILEGEYAERVHITISGTEEKPITFLAIGNVVTQGFTIQADYITIQNFEITNTSNQFADGRGIYVHGSGCLLENNYIHNTTRGGILLFAEPGEEQQTSNCTLRNNKLYQNSQNGIDVRGTNHLIEGNEIWASIQYHPNWIEPPLWVDADGIRFFGSGHIFRHNYIHDISLDQKENIDPHIDAFQTWDQEDMEAGNNCLFENNLIILSGDLTTGFQLEGGVHDLILRNNIVQTFAGVRAYRNGSELETFPENIEIYHNLFIGKLTYNPTSYPVGVSLKSVISAQIKNNIFLDQVGRIIVLDNAEDVIADYNLFYNSNNSPLSGSPQPNDLWNTNPLFIDPVNGDYHLQPESPAINAGTYVNVDQDYDGNLRDKNTVDIGPFEFTP